MVKKGKKYLEAKQLVIDGQAYAPDEAMALVKRTASSAFDETVELHIRTSADPRHADQLVRGVTVLPHGLGKEIRVLVFAQGEAATAAQEAGADYVGDDDIIKKIEGGWLEFDVAIATTDVMSKIGRLGRMLGRKGLMPNPRTGTVVQPQALAKAIGDARKGRVEYRTDRTAIIHVPLGKTSFEDEQLLDNMTVLVDAVVKARPTGVKGQYVRSAYLCTTMGPSIKLDLPKTLSLKVQ